MTNTQRNDHPPMPRVRARHGRGGAGDVGRDRAAILRLRTVRAGGSRRRAAAAFRPVKSRFMCAMRPRTRTHLCSICRGVREIGNGCASTWGHDRWYCSEVCKGKQENR